MSQGPCLDHCYTCPKNVVYLSFVGIILAFTFVVFIIVDYYLQKNFTALLDKTALNKYQEIRKHKIYAVLISIVFMTVFLQMYKPYTLFKL